MRTRPSYPFSVFKPYNKPNYYVSFKNEETGLFMPSISTRKGDKAEAVKVALDWLRDGIPKKRDALSLHQYSLFDMTKKAEITRLEAEFILKELKRRGFLKSYVLADSKADLDFSAYLLTFWDWEQSPYVQEKLRKNHGIHKRYVTEQLGIVKRFWLPYFKGKLLGEITREDIEDFINHFDRKPAEGEIALPQSAKRKNTVIKAGTLPLKWAFQKEWIDKDVAAGIVWFSGNAAERQILTPELAQAVFSTPWKNNTAKLANMLAMVTGLRAGEIQGLRVQDLGEECLYIRHSWNATDGLKTTKTNEERKVEVPFPSIMQSLIDLVQLNPWGQGLDGYIFFSPVKADKPLESQVFIAGLRDALLKTGMSDKAARVFTFHGWRHYFTAYMRERVNEKILQKQTGHKTIEMLDHYSDHELDNDREQLRLAQVETFGALIPADTAVSFQVGA